MFYFVIFFHNFFFFEKMAAGGSVSNKYPPVLGEDTAYEGWRKEVNLWQKFTDLEVKKHALAIHFSLRVKAREASMEIEESDFALQLVLQRYWRNLIRCF